MDSGRAIVDLSLGIGTRSGSFDVSLLVKNALDDDTNVAQTWNYTARRFRAGGAWCSAAGCRLVLAGIIAR